MFDTMTERELNTLEARFDGQFGYRAMVESQLFDCLPEEQQEEYERFSGPAEPKSFVPIDDMCDEAALEAIEEGLDRSVYGWQRERFFGRLRQSQNEASAIRAALQAVESRAAIYELVNRAVAFDAATPAWMFDAADCAAVNLRPLDRLDDKLQGDFERADEGLAARRAEMRARFFARLSESQAEARAIRAPLSQVRGRDVLYALINRALAFDNFTPAWMRDESACALWGLRPLDSLADVLMGDFERAEARLEHRAKAEVKTRAAFAPVRMQKGTASTIAYTPAYQAKMLKAGYRIVCPV